MSFDKPSTDQADDDRRKFLATCGKFALVTPPAITLLLSTSLNSQAVAHSGGRGSYHRHDRHERHEHHDHGHHGNNGWGKGGDRDR